MSTEINIRLFTANILQTLWLSEKINIFNLHFLLFLSSVHFRAHLKGKHFKWYIYHLCKNVGSEAINFYPSYELYDIFITDDTRPIKYGAK